jgi:hypothetical protein
MENQHRKISGYRELSQDEIDAMNAVKSMAKDVGEMIEIMEKNEGLDQRWVAIAKKHLQQGFMAATRAIAQPEFF